ncbi:MAG: peptidoglycan D,D-transpeptidase FtsI family protein [Planctomycetota bacterium]
MVTTRATWIRGSGYAMGALALLLCVQVGRLQWGEWASEDNTSLEEQTRSPRRVAGRRGDILDRRGVVMAASRDARDAYMDPVFIRSQFSDLQSVSLKIAETLMLDAETVREQLDRQSRYVVLKRDVSPEEVSALRRSPIKGVDLARTSARVYPENRAASAFLGFLEKHADNGLEGLERQHNAGLRGADGQAFGRVDIRRRLVEPAQLTREPHEGADLRLTIDVGIQRIAHKVLEQGMKDWSPKYGLILVMDPRDGGILAMAQSPTYSPDAITEEDMNRMMNLHVSACFEPGSIMKPIAWVGAYEQKALNPDQIIDCEGGSWRLPGLSRVLHDHHGYGKLTASEVLVKSSNIGMGKIAHQWIKGSKQGFPGAVLDGWMRRFGFGQRSGIDIPGEIPGLLAPIKQWGSSSWASIPMGHEVAVTPVQYVRALSVFANGGFLVQPHIEQGQGGEPRRIISEEAATRVTAILHDVVERGTAKQAKLEDIAVCGKTGTAQKLMVNGNNPRGKKIYSHESYCSSFAAFAPQINSRITVLVVMDEPRKAGVSRPFGGVVCAPMAAQVIRETLDYLELCPEAPGLLATGGLR